MSNRIAGYDFIRSTSFFLIFIYHIVNRQVEEPTVRLAVQTAAAISLSLLGLISSILLSEKEIGSGSFLIRRLTRIYIPLILCLVIVLIFQTLIGKSSIDQHTLLHLFGLTAFFKLLGVKSNATIGHGLWFVTTIIGLYFLLPVLHQLFRRPAGFWNLLGVVIACTALNYSLSGTENIFTIVISFSLGVYLGANRRVEWLFRASTSHIIFLSILMFAIVFVMLKTFDAWHPLAQLSFCMSSLAFFPLFFNFGTRLPSFLITCSTLFASLSYEFYILHFYFINEGFQEFFKLNVGIFGHITIAFAAVFALSLVLSRIGSFLVSKANNYLCGTAKESGEKTVDKNSYRAAAPVIKS